MNIIGLVGFIGSGKDTVAKILTQNGCVQDSFASPLKELCASVFGWPLEMLQGDTVESRDFRETPDIFWSRKLGIDHFTPRLALQLLGTEVMRDHFNQDIWINSLEYRLRMKNADYPCVVISDARFQNELSLIKSIAAMDVLIYFSNITSSLMYKPNDLFCKCSLWQKSLRIGDSIQFFTIVPKRSNDSWSHGQYLMFDTPWYVNHISFV